MTVIRRLNAGNEQGVIDAASLFDRPPQPDATAEFLGSPGHHLLVAYDDDTPAGFTTGIEMTHPDKGREMFLYELAVGELYRRRGIGTDLVNALARLALELGCYGMWVLTDPHNAAALATYCAGGAVDQESAEMLSWRFDEPRP